MANGSIKLSVVIAVVGLVVTPSAWPVGLGCRAEEEQNAKKKDKSAVDAKDKKAPPKIYDTEADGNEQIDEAVKRAKAEKKRVLLKFGANWCGWCHKLSKCFKTEPEISEVLKENYVLVLIDVDAKENDQRHNADVIERYGNPTKHGLPVLVVLDADGKQLTTQDTGLLEVGDHHDPEKVLAFLEKWKPVKELSGSAVGQSRGARFGVDYEWVPVTEEAAFAPRDGAGALVFRDRMWLLGGWNPNDKRHFPRITSNDVWSSHDGAAWRLEKPNSFVDQFDPSGDWEGRHTGGYVVYKDKMWIIGGDANQKHYQNDVWNSADGKTWFWINQEQPVPWGPRVLHYTLVFQDKIWVMGGQTMPGFAPSKEVFHRDIWNSSDGARWERVMPREPFWPARGMIGGSVVFKDRMWVLGGGTYDTPTTPERRFYNDVWSSPDGESWTCHATSAAWGPRQYHDVAVFDDRMWVLEGWNGTNRNDVWHSADGVEWRPLADTPWKPRHAASVFVYDDALWIVAGNNMESDVWKLCRRKLR
ncbi:MAG: thioredoxin family protein [Terriglobales bacterium]